MAISSSDAKSIVLDFTAIAAERSQYETTWQDIADFMLGRRNFLTLDTTGGEHRMRNIYDTTAQHASTIFASGLNALLTSSAVKWFDLVTADKQFHGNFEVQLWLEQVRDHLWQVIHAPAANFNQQVAEVYTDLVMFGTGPMFVGERPGGVFFNSRPLGEIFVVEGNSGIVDTVYRRFHYSARQAVQHFGDMAPAVARRAIQSDSPHQSHTYLHLVHPNPDPIYGKRDARGMPFTSRYVNVDDEVFVAPPGGFWEMPYMTPRWDKDSTEPYGRGPGWNALADCKMLNQMKKTTLKAAQKAVDPPVIVPDDGVLVQLDLSPGGLNVARAGVTNSDPIRPIEHNGRIIEGMALIENTQQQVKDAFMSQLMQRAADPRMTATQVIELATKAQELAGPMLGRVQSELLEPLIDRVFGIESRAGRLPVAPDFLQGQELRVDYQSPVARAQRHGEAQAIEATVAIAAQMREVFPDVEDNIDPDEAIRSIADARGMPSRVLNTPDKVAAIRAAKNQAAAEKQQFEEVIAGAEAAGKAAPALEALGELGDAGAAGG